MHYWMYHPDFVNTPNPTPAPTPSGGSGSSSSSTTNAMNTTQPTDMEASSTVASPPINTATAADDDVDTNTSRAIPSATGTASTATANTAAAIAATSSTTCWLCLPSVNDCEARVRRCLMEQFRSTHAHVCTGYLQKYFEGGEQQGQYYAKPSESDVDTQERKNRRMAQIAEVVFDNVSGFTGYGMVLKVTNGLYLTIFSD